MTFREVKVPMDVTFSWAGSETCLATFTWPKTFAPLSEYRAAPLPLRFDALSWPTVEVPDTLRLVRVPSDVMSGWAAVETVPNTFVA